MENKKTKKQSSYRFYTNAQKAEIIEYFVNNPNTKLTEIGKIFNCSYWTVTEILTKNYFHKKPEHPEILVLQSNV